MSLGDRSLLAASLPCGAGDSPTCALASASPPSRLSLLPRLPLAWLWTGPPSSASKETSSDSASSSPIYSDSVSPPASFIGSASGSSAPPRALPVPGLSRVPWCPSVPPCFAAVVPPRRPPPVLVRLAACLSPSIPSATLVSPRLCPPRLPRLLPYRADPSADARPPCLSVLAGVAPMTGKRRHPVQSDRPAVSAVPSPSKAQEVLAPALLRAVAALVEHEGAGTPARRREPVYRSPRGQTHPHLCARGGSFRRRRPPRPPPAVQRVIVGPLLQPHATSLRLAASPSPSPSGSLQFSQQMSSGVAALPPPMSPQPRAPSAPLSAPVPAPPPSSSRPLAPLPLASSAGEPLAIPPQHPSPSSCVPLVEPPSRQHPLVPSGSVPEARFPPPRARSPELPPDAPDPEDDERWWNRELWESSPQPATLCGREWDIQSDFVKDVLQWEKRMLAVGECLSHVATMLEQLHAGLMARNLVLRDPQLTEPQQGVVREAAAQGLWRLLRLTLESEFPDLDEGPGVRAFRQVAKAAEESPLQLVPALAVLLRWIRRRFYVPNRV
ncbi:unnamed protein product [Closterium sp. Naga37s-1]|nr:unnamed protein product [Closterium sp. Naga37s-1]